MHVYTHTLTQTQTDVHIRFEGKCLLTIYCSPLLHGFKNVIKLKKPLIHTLAQKYNIHVI